MFVIVVILVGTVMIIGVAEAEVAVWSYSDPYSICVKTMLP